MYKKHLFKSISFILMLLFLLFMFSCKKDNTDYSEIKSILDTVLETDQVHRLKIMKIYQQNGKKSREHDSLLNLIKKSDSINLIIITNILDEYG